MFAAKGAITYAVEVKAHGSGFVAEFPALPCRAFGATYQEALSNARQELIQFLEKQTREGTPFIEERELSAPSTLSITVQRPFISSIEAAKRFRITNDYVARLCRTSKVRGFCVGRTWYVNEVSLKLFLDSVTQRQKEKWQTLSREFKGQSSV